VICSVGYGLLEMMLVCALPDIPVFGVLRGRLQLLVVIQPCQTSGKDATRKLTYYKGILSPFVTDIVNVKAIVGRIQTRGKWGIVDRLPGTAAAMFGDVDQDDE